MKLFLALPLLLVGCSSMPDSNTMANAGATCFQGPGWNGGQVLVLVTNVDKGTILTGGGSVTVNCGAASTIFTDAGSVVKPTPAKVTP